MTGLAIATGVTAVSAIIFMRLRYFGKEESSFLFKLFASIGFVLIGLIGAFLNKSNLEYSVWIIMALSLGLLGDICLGLKNILFKYKLYLVSVGIVLFLFGHIAYSIVFIGQVGANYVVFVVNILVATILMTIAKILKLKLSFAYRILGFLYCYTITLMLTSAAGYFLFNAATLTGWLVLIGSANFYASDLMLSVSYFKPDIKKKNKLNLFVHITYYIAQILLALSIFFV